MNSPKQNSDFSELDWNFSAVPDEELAVCCLWEYARESAHLRSIRDRTSQARRRKMKSNELFEFVVKDYLVVSRALWRKAILFQEGLCEMGGQFYAKGFVSPFPKQWLRLSKEDRRVLVETAEWPRKEDWDPGFTRASFKEMEDLTKSFRPKSFEEVFPSGVPMKEFYHSGNKLRALCPHSVGEYGMETLLVNIDWAGFTNQDLVRHFAQWLTENSPPDVRRPDRRGGDKRVDWRAKLARLGVMRLLSRHKVLEIVDDRRKKFAAIWETKQFSGAKWADVNKWYDARREAEQFFRKLFPFLSPDEKPLSWERKASAE
jgi:hypothetical protein